MILTHPSERQLLGAADSPTTVEPRLQAHLARCDRCRERVRFVRELRAAVAALPSDSLLDADTALEERIVARVKAGERAILPLEAEPPRAPRRASRWLAAATVILSAGVWMAWPRESITAGALTGELRFSSPGIVSDSITVEYRSAAVFGDAPWLVLRARYRGTDADSYNHASRQLPVARLVRAGDGRYIARLAIPDSVVYAAFAVEDADARHVDHHGQRLWELMRRTADGRPTFVALMQRARDHMGRNSELVLETFRQRLAHYPDHPDALADVVGFERFMLGRQYADSMRAIYRERLYELHERYDRETVSLDVAEGMDGLAIQVSDGTVPRVRAIGRAWRARVLADSSRQLPRMAHHVFAVADSAKVDSARALLLYERLYEEIGTRLPFLLNNAWVTALEMNDAEAMLRWADRSMALTPSTSQYFIEKMLRIPSLRGAALSRLRTEIQRLDAGRDSMRPLESTREQQRRSDRLAAGRLLAVLGENLVEMGQTKAGIDTLDLAARASWDATLARRIADVHLRAGDSAGALRYEAMVAADAETSTTFADSVLERHKGRVDRARWNALVTEAKGEMHRRVLEDAVRLRLTSATRLVRGTGGETTLAAVAQGRPIVVTFWSRHCGPSRQQMSRLDALAQRLQRQGAVLVAITAEEPSRELTAFLQEMKLAIPIYHDRWREAGRALGQYATPEFHVLDRRGQVRFSRSTIEKVVAQAAALSE